MQVATPRSDDEFQRYFKLRWQVLRQPYGQPPGSERDELDLPGSGAEHAAIFDAAGQAIAIGRIHLNSPDEAQIRYMAVAESRRGQGLGRLIVTRLEEVARSWGVKAVVLNARREAAGFYETLGYETVGPGPTLFGTVDHVHMSRKA